MKKAYCAECGRERPHYAHGLCKQCYMRQWRKTHRVAKTAYDRDYREAHRGEMAAYMHAYNEARRAERVAYMREYRKSHRVEAAAYKRKYYKAHRIEIAAYSREWKQANADKHREAERRRQARKHGATIGPVDEVAIYKRDGHACMYCGTTHGPLAIDHIVALNNHGPHCEDNLVVACRRCNSSKGTKPLEDWLLTQERALVWVL